jgi:hypothetical protein
MQESPTKSRMIGLSLDDSITFAINIVCMDKSQASPWFRPSSFFPWIFVEGSSFKLPLTAPTHLRQICGMRGTFPAVARCCCMSQIATELRQAAASARAFADNLGSAELKRSFREMARRWEAEANERDTRERRSATPRSSRPETRSPTRKH